jgi:hypothetical protein
MSWNFGLCAMILTASSAFALVEKTIDEKHPLDVVFSTTTHNRIAVEGGAVEKIFGDSSLFSVHIDPATGNAFIHIAKELDHKPAALTVVTSTGAVQDLLVRSSEGPSEQIVLKEEEQEEWVIRPIVSHASTLEFLTQVIDGNTPAGYGAKEWEEDLQLPEPLFAEPVKALEGPFETLHVYRITNPEEKLIILDADVLKKDKNSWVYLSNCALKDGMESVCIIGKVKNEN